MRMEFLALIVFTFIGLQIGIAFAKKSGVIIKQKPAMLGFAIAVIGFTILNFSQQGYVNKDVVSFSGIEVTKESYDRVKKNRNGSDEEAKKYFIRAKAKDKVIVKMAKDYGVSVEKDELEKYMNESFAAFTEDEKLALAAMDGFSSFEDYAKSPRTQQAAELVLTEMKLIQAMVPITKDQSNAETDNKLAKEAQNKIEEEILKEIKNFKN